MLQDHRQHGTCFCYPLTGGFPLINPHVHVQASLFLMAFIYGRDSLARTKVISIGMGKKKYFGDLTEMYFLSVLEVRHCRSNVTHGHAPWENLILSLPASDYISNEGIILNVTTLYEERRFLISIPYASSLKNTCQIIIKNCQIGGL